MGSAKVPDRYQAGTANKSVAKHEWVCAIKDCRALCHSLPDLNVHVREVHNNNELDDNMDGTLSVGGDCSGRDVPGVTQRSVTNKLDFPDSRLRRRSRSVAGKPMYVMYLHPHWSQEDDTTSFSSANKVASNCTPEHWSIVLNDLEHAKTSDLWKHVKAFLPRRTQDVLTSQASELEVRALIQLLSYPKKRNLERGWVTSIRNKNKRRELCVITLVLRAVSDEDSTCTFCKQNEVYSHHCSSLSNIRPEHEALKDLVGGKCCYCVLLEKECQMPSKAAKKSSHSPLKNAVEDVPQISRLQRRYELSLMLTQAIEANKSTLPPRILDNAQHVSKCAEDVELRVFESRISSDGYLAHMNTICTKLRQLRGRQAVKWLSEVVENSFSFQSIDTASMPSLSSQEASGEDLGNATGNGKSRDHRRDSASSERSRHPSLSIEKANLSGHHKPETFGSIMRRTMSLGADIQKLEERGRSDVMRSIALVLSHPRLDITQKVLEMAVSIQKAPLELRQEMRQACVGLLQAMLPEDGPTKWAATVLADAELPFERDVLDLVIAMRRVHPDEQDGLGQRVLSTLYAYL